MSNSTNRTIWLKAAIAVLALLGITSSVFRTIALLAPGGAAVQLERRLSAGISHDEGPIRQFEARFAAHPALTALHVIPGALFLALAPLQFSRRIRARHIRVHRWSGRLLVALAITGTMVSFYFGVLHPIAGFAEAVPIATFGALMLVAVARGWTAARRGDLARHRRWMIRAFAIALAISSVRIAAAIIQSMVVIDPVTTMVIAFWVGWLLTIGAAEIYLRATATSARTYSSPVRGTGSALPQL